MELLLLLKVKWDPYAPTAKDFLPMLLTNLRQNGFLNEESQKMVKRHAQAYIDLIAIGKLKKISLTPSVGRFLEFSNNY